MHRDTQATNAPLKLDAFLPYRLAVAADAVSKGLAAVYAERFGISIAEWRIIANLGQHGPMTAGEASRQSSLDKVQVTRALQRLKMRRLISRTQVKADRRQVRLALTADGTRMFRDIAALALAWERDILADLPESQRRALFEMLSQLVERAQSMAACP